MRSRLDELTERARQTLARTQPPRPVPPVHTVPGLPPLPGVPGLPEPPQRTIAPSVGAANVTMGIDPGVATMGYGIVRGPDATGGAGTDRDGPGGFESVTFGALTTPAGEALERRLLTLYGGLRDLLRTHRPSQVAVEQLFFGKNATTAAAVGQARGVALLAAAEFGLPVFEYKPAEVKFTIAGFGKADKAQMQRMVQTLLGLDSIPRPDDAADALAIALCHLRNARVRTLGFR